MNFSEYLWHIIDPIYQRIITHPFNLELAHGTLTQKRFNFYIQQDSLYLIDFSKTLALIAGRSRSVGMIHTFLNFSTGALIAERALHQYFLDFKESSTESIERSPACIAYTSYLIQKATTASLEEAIAAVLPCFWIYREVGRSIAQSSKDDNPYVRCIQTYSSQEFSDQTDQAIAILDQLACQCSDNLLKSMENSFKSCALFEWHFWNDAYHTSFSTIE